MEKDTLKELYDYLDSFNFVDDMEIELAVNDFFMDQWNINPSRSDCLYYSELAEQYKAQKK